MYVLYLISLCILWHRALWKTSLWLNRQPCIKIWNKKSRERDRREEHRDRLRGNDYTFRDRYRGRSAYEDVVNITAGCVRENAGCVRETAGCVRETNTYSTGEIGQTTVTSEIETGSVDVRENERTSHKSGERYSIISWEPGCFHYSVMFVHYPLITFITIWPERIHVHYI